VYAHIDGLVVLEPVVSISDREMLVWGDPALAEQIRRGTAEAEASRTTDLGSFAQFLDEEDHEK
jgi:hypothetical protein